MTETQGWILIIEIAIISLYFLLALLGIRSGRP